MKHIFLFPYHLIRWLIILFIVLFLLLLLIVEKPSLALTLLKKPLEKQGISYGSIQGGLLSGFTLHDLNYQEKAKIQELSVKIDLDQLENHLLYIDNLQVEGIELEREFLKSLIETNSSKESSKEGKILLPFDNIIVKDAKITLKEIGYQNYFIKSAKLEVKNLRSDMKKQHKGDLHLLLDSNITQLDLNASIENENLTIFSDIVPNRNFIATFITKYNLQLKNDPHFTINANGNTHLVHYELITHRLSLQQDQYQIQSKKLQLSGDYNLDKKDLYAVLKSDLLGNMASLKLNSSSRLNLDDLNNTLRYKLDADFSPKHSFLTKLLKEQNISLQEDPQLHIESQGNFKTLDYDLKLSRLKLKQNTYQVESGTIKLNGAYSVEQEDLIAKLKGAIHSNIANIDLSANTTLNIQDLNESLKFDSQGDILVKSPFLNGLLSEQNISIKTDSLLKFKAKGGLETLDYHLNLMGLTLKKSPYQLNNESIKVEGKYSIIQQDLDLNLTSEIQSNIADIQLSANSTLNLQDLNESFSVDSKGTLLGKSPLLNQLLKEHNITIQHAPQVDFKAKGELDQIRFSTHLKQLKLKQNDLSVSLPTVAVEGKINALGGESHLKITGHVDSSAGIIDLNNTTSLNFKDLNKSLSMENSLKIEINPHYVNSKIKEHNITLEGRPKIEISTQGGLNNLLLQVDAKAQLQNEKRRSTIDLHSSPISLDIKQHRIKGSIKLSSNAKHLGLKIQSQFNGDYTQAKKIQSTTDIQIKNFNAFGINLEPLVPLKLQAQTDKKGASIALNAERIKLNAQTSNYDVYQFNIKSRNLYLYKMMELPPELDHKFIKLDLQGSATLSKEYFNLEGDLYSNKKFNAKINAKNSASGFDATLATQHLILKASGDLKKKNIEATMQVDSLDALQKEFNALYAFETIELDGRLEAEASLKGKNIVAKLNSPKLTFKDFNVEKLSVHADYRQERLTLNTFQFNTTGFKDKKLNQKFYLTEKGVVHLGERRDIHIEMHPNIHIQAMGDKNNLSGQFKIEKLPLGHPEYGSLVLSTEIDYLQEGKRRTITGDINLKKMKLFYEAKFLDPANDPDVVIITKKDKKNKEHSEDSFLNYTAIDLNIKAPQANYKTPDIDLLFDINLKADKAFGKELALLGKIEEITGRVDQVPKRFQIVNSNIVFKGGKKINPLLDINVEYELPQVLIHIAIGGDANHPKLEFTSEPPMPKKDIMSYLLLGVSTASLAEGEGSLSREAELFILNQAARDLAYELELDRIFIKDDGTGEGFAIEAGKKISPKNMVIIESSKEGNSFILEHDINKNIKLRLGQHQKEIPSQSIDIYFRKKFK